MGMTPRELLRQVELPLALPSDRCRRARRGGRRRRLGDDRRCDRRWRSRRVHLSRSVDGRHDRDPRRRHSCRGARAGRGRIAAVARAPALRPPAIGSRRAAMHRPPRSSRPWYCCRAASPRGGTGGTIVVGSKNFTEQLVLGELLAQAIEKRNRSARRSTAESRRHDHLRSRAARPATSTSTSSTPARR